jgi:hypothetical protein
VKKELGGSSAEGVRIEAPKALRVERRRREDRGAVGAEGGGVWGGGTPLPIEIFFIFKSKKMHFIGISGVNCEVLSVEAVSVIL